MGESIYRRGVGGGGVPVEASREAGATMRGSAVACANCHRRSGLGSKEGRTLIPPIAGRYLFHPPPNGREEFDLPFVEGARGNQEPYTDVKLVRAIREGVDAGGHSLSYLMPRYALGDTDMADLVAYLKRLERRKVPGVSATELHFATIITPDADPSKRHGMLDVLHNFFEERNSHQPDPTAAMLTSGKTAFSKMMFRVNRHWELHVWELTGPESTWREQLERKLEKQPVFAVVSGLAGSNWAPVHSFCEQAGLPCIFPNVEVPPAGADRDFYSLYFSRGLLLEADLIAKQIVDEQPTRSLRAVRQVYRAGDVGEAGAGALGAVLRQRGISESARMLAAQGPADLANALRDIALDEAVVLWLRPADLASLPAQRPASLTTIYASGLMGGLERLPLPAAWRGPTRVAYPFELPDARRVRVDFALGWFRIRGIPVVAEQVQADTYLACGLLSETVKHMVDNFVRDYLIERFEDTLEHRIVTGYYPRLSLATGQRFASKGGYVVRLDGAASRVVADRPWTVP